MSVNAEASLSAGVKVETIDRKHPDYEANKDAWEDNEFLYKGNRYLRAIASRFLARRPKEPDDVFNARIKRFIYTNLLGTIIGWYGSKLFRQEPEIDLAVKNPDGTPSDDDQLPGEQTEFFNEFQLNCDKKGTTFIDFYRQRLVDCMLYGKSFAILDRPYVDPSTITNKAQQKAAGAFSVYLVAVHAAEIINWEKDEIGNLLWCVRAQTSYERGFLQPDITVDRWTYYDQTTFKVYERRYSPDQEPPLVAVLVREGIHATAKMKRVPVYHMCVPDGLWLANRAYLPVCDHLNTENAFAWALMNNNLAVPVVTGMRDEQTLTISEVGVVALPEGATYSYTEQSGKAFQVSIDRLNQIREEIFRICYLLAQGKSTSATASAQSGISKQQDMQPAEDVLNQYGDIIRADQQLMLSAVGEVQGYNDLYVDVRGYSFEGTNPIDELDLVDTGLTLQIPSDTLDKELLKKGARVLLTDANQGLIAKVMKEIDDAPNAAERQAIAAAQQAQMMADKIRQSVDAGKVPVSPKGPASGGPSSSGPSGS